MSTPFKCPKGRRILPVGTPLKKGDLCHWWYDDRWDDFPTSGHVGRRKVGDEGYSPEVSSFPAGAYTRKIEQPRRRTGVKAKKRKCVCDVCTRATKKSSSKKSSSK